MTQATDFLRPTLTGTQPSALLVPAFVLTTILSACLIFLVQPMIAKLVLPLLGGSSSVWIVTTVFFQAMLLLGYAYAHAISSWLPVRVAIILHVALLALGFWLINFDVGSVASINTTSGETWRLLSVLFGTVGLPFGVMSANAPLMQKWFSLSGHKDAHEPYFLYAASNIGSIGALLLYPIVLEPWLRLAGQTATWTTGFGLLTLAILACGSLIFAREHIQFQKQASTTVARNLIAPWLAFSCLPAALLSAFTNHITIDVASVPFLWLPPLILYLLSFVVVFRPIPLVSMPLLRAVAQVTLPAAFLFSISPGGVNIAFVIAVGIACFFSVTCISHRKLYELRPDAGGLTGFYFIMSVGGVLGGASVAFLAPAIFSQYTEYSLLLALAPLALLASYMPIAGLTRERLAQTLLLIAAVLVCVFINIKFSEAGEAYWGYFPVIAISIFAALVALRAKNLILAFGTFAMAVMQVVVSSSTDLGSARNFYGVLSVHESNGFYRLNHGSTVHGAIKTSELSAPGKPSPRTYYGPTGGMARSIMSRQQQLAAEGQPGKFGVVGLGAGSLACYAKPGETWRFFEINPAVTQFANNPKYFSFMDRCAPTAPVIQGDARLTLQQEEQESFDVLVIDAFSSDSIPVHLITVEAMEIYLGKLRPDGILVFHISNRHLSLVEVLRANMLALAKKTGQGLSGLQYDDPAANTDELFVASEVVAISANPQSLVQLEKTKGAVNLTSFTDVKPWTDDFSNVVSALLRMHGLW